MEGKNLQNRPQGLLYKPSIKLDECISSYLIRVSDRNGFGHIGKLLKHAGLNWKNNRAPVHQILTGEFDITPLLSELQLPEAFSKLAPIYQSFQRVIDTSYIITKYPKICPECLQEMGFCRYQWALLPVVACTKHHKILVDVNPTDGKRLSWYRQYLNRFDDESYPIKMARTHAKSSSIQQSLYIEALISGKNPSSLIPVVLMGLDLREALSLVHFIAHYQKRLLGGSFNPVALSNYELAHVYEKVWETLRGWPDSFYLLLSQYVDRPMSSKGQAGLNKHFRDLYERLHRQHENKGIARIKEEFGRYIEVYWPGVLEPERISRIRLGSVSRNIISKKETARILESRIERIDKLVQQGRVTPVIFKGKTHYLRDQIEALANEISSNWTMDEACKVLEMSRYQLKQLLDAGIIPTLQKPNSLNRDWVVDRTECLSLINVLRNNARKSESPSDAVSLVSVYRRGYSIVQLVLAMQSGDVEYGINEPVSSAKSFQQFVCFTIKT